jgi:hypothetical protein
MTTIGSGSNPDPNAIPSVAIISPIKTDPATGSNQALTNNLLTSLLAYVSTQSVIVGSVLQAGSTGVDFSTNAATIPISGLVLLRTIPVFANRAYVEIQNQSANAIQIVRDDGANNNQTSLLLASGGAPNTQGGGWTSATFKGRILIYGVAGSQISAYQD